MRRMYSLEQLKKVAQEVASSGELENVKVFEEIIDKDGHKRFVEGNGEGYISSDIVELSYCKWSLSGSHLMFAVAGTIKDGQTFPQYATLAGFTLPSWILNKIQPVWNDTYIEKKSVIAIDNSWVEKDFPVILSKTESQINIITISTFEISGTKYFRTSFDLLIDNQ